MSDYRLWQTSQLENARLVAMLRQSGDPLAEIEVILALPRAAAERIASYCSGAIQEYATRRDMAS